MARRVYPFMAGYFHSITGAVCLAACITVVGAAPARAAPILVAEGPQPVSALLAGASASKGRRIARKCARCHSFKKDAARKVGPNLWGVVGANKGEGNGFDYSPALKAKGGRWSYEDLDAFLANPQGFMPGTRMDFDGLGDAEDRAHVIAYLRSLADRPAPPP